MLLCLLPRSPNKKEEFCKLCEKSMFFRWSRLAPQSFDIQLDCVTNLKCLKPNNNQLTNIKLVFNISLENLDYSENRAAYYKVLKYFCNFQAMDLKSACLIIIDFVWLKLLKHLDILNMMKTLRLLIR